MKDPAETRYMLDLHRAQFAFFFPVEGLCQSLGCTVRAPPARRWDEGQVRNVVRLYFTRVGEILPPKMSLPVWYALWVEVPPSISCELCIEV